jgi:predicted transcriptional regulator
MIFRSLGVLAALIVVLSIGFYFLSSTLEVSHFIKKTFETGEFLTFEAKVSPESVSQVFDEKYPPHPEASSASPQLCYAPHLLMEVKFFDSKTQNTQEGVLLWSQLNGEIITSTNPWQNTHGFEDCIRQKATEKDFQIIFAIANSKQPLNREEIQTRLNVDSDTLSKWLDSSLEKHLITKQKGAYNLHFSNPYFTSKPITQLNESLVKKKFKGTPRISEKYSRSQIHKISTAAFQTEDFSIRKTTQIYIPVFKLTVVNPDQSNYTSYWNALTGEEMSFTLL